MAPEYDEGADITKARLREAYRPYLADMQRIIQSHGFVIANNVGSRVTGSRFPKNTLVRHHTLNLDDVAVFNRFLDVDNRSFALLLDAPLTKMVKGAWYRSRRPVPALAPFVASVHIETTEYRSGIVYLPRPIVKSIGIFGRENVRRLHPLLVELEKHHSQGKIRATLVSERAQWEFDVWNRV